MDIGEMVSGGGRPEKNNYKGMENKKSKWEKIDCEKNGFIKTYSFKVVELL